MEDKGSGQKRSIFRSPGTASSPDLATLVRLAKEAKGIPATPQTAGNPLTNQAESRSRAASRATQPDWEGMSTNGDVRSVSSGFSGGNKMATISERSRSKQGEDGFKVSTHLEGCADIRAYGIRQKACLGECLEAKIIPCVSSRLRAHM